MRLHQAVLGSKVFRHQVCCYTLRYDLFHILQRIGLAPLPRNAPVSWTLPHYLPSNPETQCNHHKGFVGNDDSLESSCHQTSGGLVRCGTPQTIEVHIASRATHAVMLYIQMCANTTGTNIWKQWHSLHGLCNTLNVKTHACDFCICIFLIMHKVKTFF